MKAIANPKPMEVEQLNVEARVLVDRIGENVEKLIGV